MQDDDLKKFMISLIELNKEVLRTEGTVFALLGLFTLAVPSSPLFVGIGALIAATATGYRIVKGQALPNTSSIGMNLLIYLILGLVLLLYPLSAVVTLNLMLASFFIFDGIFKLTSSIQMQPAPRWGWLFFNAFLSFLFAMLIVMLWPTGSSWVLGRLFGISLLCTGLAELNLLRKSKT